ncbi:MAG TPA: glycosyltransferase [Candidatus Saccharimonadales bacterium]
MPIKSVQRYLAMLLVLLVGADSLLIVGLKPAAWTILLVYLSAFRLVNLLKLVDGRKQKDYLRSSFLRSSLHLAGYQAVVLGLTYLAGLFGLSFQNKWSLLIWLEFFALIIVALSLRRNFVKTRPDLKFEFIKESKLPTLTVAIPARNETEDLKECLGSLVASDYPKLEILVLDDCSQLKRTPEIIRQFAHDGVTFIEGQEPESSWTAKNYAYDQLASKANGDLILFCGVDVRFERQSLRQMVELLLAKDKRMMSFMPVNELPDKHFKSLLVQPLRYLWELGLPRRSLNRPPVLSTCWLIDKKALKSCGGFKAVSRNILPERYFARQTARDNDDYSFVCLGKALGLSAKKSFEEQVSTAIRTRYPRVKQHLENDSILSLAEAAIFISPVALLVYELVSRSWFFAVLSSLNVVIGSLIAFSITMLTYDKKLPLSLIAYPAIFAYDIALSLYSMWQYEFNEVVWKGRNVCIPVMQAIPKLPKGSD